jgi:hypothetical protein
MATLKNVTMSGTAGIVIPKGTTAQRPGSPATGDFRYNTTLKLTEYYNGSYWLDTDTNVPTEIPITSGLICHVDAGRTDSYPGSGTTWTDLSGNSNHFTLTNGPTFDANDAGGALKTDGSNDHITNTSMNLSTSDYTIIIANRYYPGGVTNGRICSGNSTNWLLGGWANRTRVHYSQGWVSPSALNTAVPGGDTGTDYNWLISIATRDHSADQSSHWVNGLLQQRNSAGGGGGPNGLTFGRYGPGNSEFSTSQHAFCAVYNRVLTDQEIFISYEYARQRFGV